MRIRYRYNRFQRIWEAGGLACLGLCALCLGINWQRVAAEGLPASARIGGVAYLALTVFQGFTAVFAHPEPEGKPQKPIYQRPELTLWGTPLRYDGNSDWGYYVRRMDAAVILRAAVAAVFAPAVIAAAFGAPLGRWYVTAGLIVMALFLGYAIARLLGPAQRRG